jgi:hypothetical protein
LKDEEKAEKDGAVDHSCEMNENSDNIVSALIERSLEFDASNLPNSSYETSNHLTPLATMVTQMAWIPTLAIKPGAMYSVQGLAYSSGVRIRRRESLALAIVGFMGRA